jgi:hypothetical protein
MPVVSSPRSAVRIAYGLVTVLFLGSLAFGLVVLASMGVGLARGGDSLLYGDTLRVPMQVSTAGLGPLAPGLVLDAFADVTVEIEDPSVEQMLLQSARDLGPLAVSIGALWLTRGVLRSTVRNDPFGRRNVRRLRDLGVLLAVGGTLAAAVDYQLRLALFNDLPPRPSVDLGVSGFTLPGGFILAGLLAFVLAAIFAYGADLRDDVDGTI